MESRLNSRFLLNSKKRWFSLVTVVIILLSIVVNIWTKFNLNLSLTQPSRFHLGVQATEAEAYQQALLYFSQAIRSNDHQASAYSNRCLIYLHLQKYRKAEVDCSQSIQSNPQNFSAYLHRGLAYFHQGKYDLALADYNQALELQPDQPEVYYNRGLLDSAQQDYNRALNDYNLASQYQSSLTKQQQANLDNDWGLAYFNLHHWEEAIAHFNNAIATFPQEAWFYYNRACTYSQQGLYPQALEDYDRALQLSPNQWEFYLNLGLLYHRLGNSQRALENLHKAANFLEANGQFAEAIQIRNLTLEFHKNSSKKNRILTG